MKKLTSILTALIMIFSAFSALAVNVDSAYNEFKSKHPDFIKSLTDNSISEATLKDFIKDIDNYLSEMSKTTTITKSNFEKCAMDAIMDVSSREKYYTLQDTLIILYPEAIKLAVKEKKVSSEFKPLVETVKSIYFGKNNGGGGGGGGGSSSDDEKEDEKTENTPSDEKEDVISPQPTISFTDIKSSHWAYDSVINLAEKFILNGYLDGTFKPESNITRAEFAKIIVSSTGSVDPYALSTFKDVNNNDWYYSYVSTAYSMGYITGYPDGSFRPNDNITRADICTIVNRVLKAENTSSVSAFTDDSLIPSYAKDAVYALNSKGVINGYQDGTFAPLTFATRAQTAKIIYGAFFKTEV